jgi:hypothetical protein
MIGPAIGKRQFVESNSLTIARLYGRIGAHLFSIVDSIWHLTGELGVFRRLPSART